MATMDGPCLQLVEVALLVVVLEYALKNNAENVFALRVPMWP